MLDRKYTGVLLVVALLLMLVYSLIGLFGETKSRAKIIEEKDILMFSASEDIELDDSLTELDSRLCLEKSAELIGQYDPYTKGLEKVTIHYRKDLRRGLASRNRIWIRCLKDLEEFENIFIHELGHIVAQNYLSDELESKFYNLPGGSVSGYGEERPEEDFAETFLMYVKYGEEFRHILQYNISTESKYVFIRDFIFDGFEFASGNGLNEEVIAKYEDPVTFPYDISVLHKS